MTADPIADEVTNAIETALGSLADDLAEIEARRRDLYDARLAIWQQAVKLGWTQPRIAAASRASVHAVTQALHRARTKP